MDLARAGRLVALRKQFRTQGTGPVYLRPTADRLAFAFTHAQKAAQEEDDEADDSESPTADDTLAKHQGFSSGEHQIAALREIVNNTSAAVYLLDEWDANLDATHRAAAKALIDQLAARARVVEISHRDAA
jgi:ABC-type transport system involved in cytochrome bd biosynthesis fused ATPase/permease subunit